MRDVKQYREAIQHDIECVDKLVDIMHVDVFNGKRYKVLSRPAMQRMGAEILQPAIDIQEYLSADTFNKLVEISRLYSDVVKVGKKFDATFIFFAPKGDIKNTLLREMARNAPLHYTRQYNEQGDVMMGFTVEYWRDFITKTKRQLFSTIVPELIMIKVSVLEPKLLV